MKRGEDRVEAKKVSLLDLPKEIMKDVIPSVVPDDEAIKIKRKLLMTCKAFSFFQEDMDKKDAERLLSYVLQGNAKEAKKMYDANPRLLFIEATAKEYAAGIDENGMAVHRTVTESPCIAAARAGDFRMLKDMKEQFGKVRDKRSQKTGDDLAKEQLDKVFPNGFDYPASTYDFIKLAQAITNDTVLINAILNGALIKATCYGPVKVGPDTEEELAQFRKDFMPSSEKVGYHFNLKELIKACEVYNSYYQADQWNEYQLAVFRSQVVGYLSG